jgi:hypothetical protein
MPALGKWDKSWRVAVSVSAEHQCTPEQLRADASLAFAVDLLAEHVDDNVRSQLLDPGCMLSDKQIRSIANTAPPRMRFAIEQFRSGCRDPLRVKTDVFDTVAFAEINSRIARADGIIRASLLFLNGAHTTETTRQVERVTTVIDSLLGVLEACAHLGGDAPVCDEDASFRPPTKRGHRNQLNAGIAFLTKCVRDVPRLSNQLLPTAEERASCIRRVRGLQDFVADHL